MSVTARIRRPRRTITTAAALGVVLASGTLLTSAPAIAAEAAPQAKLTVQAPPAIGFAGQPVEFTETIANPGTGTAGYDLTLSTTTALGTPDHAIVIDYRDPADGGWKSVPLRTTTDDAVHYTGTVPGAITVPAGAAVTVGLRIGAPMGTPHRGAHNGGFPSISLLSTVGTGDGLHTALETRTSQIGVDSVSSSLAHVPATAVAGGAPIEFDAVLANPTLSDYVNVGNVLFADRHATVQVRTADGTWNTLKPVGPDDPDSLPGFYLEGRDSSIRTGSTTTTRVRVAFDATTPAGDTGLHPCVYVNESEPFWGTTNCSKGATVKITALAATQSPTPTATPSPTASATATATATATAGTTAADPAATTRAPSAVPTVTDTPDAAGDRLAETGAGRAPTLLAAGASLVTAGGGALWLTRRRRSA